MIINFIIYVQCGIRNLVELVAVAFKFLLIRSSAGFYIMDAIYDENLATLLLFYKLTENYLRKFQHNLIFFSCVKTRVL